MRKRKRYVDDGYVVRPEVGHDDELPVGRERRMNGRVWTFASLVPTSTRATSAFGDAAAARSTSMNEIVLPSKATCDASACDLHEPMRPSHRPRTPRAGQCRAFARRA
jgi:hypothetical protein